MNNTPLVSIPVITYNSSKYIIEGLESLKNQTYKNIELVISDDCSTDNTVEICQKWLNENKQYFKRAIIVTTDKNTGVAGNLNRAIRECHGEWIKTLSGDDKFLTYTIEGYVNFIKNHPNCNIAFAKLKMFGENNDLINKLVKYNESNYYPIIRIQNRNYQKKENLKKLCVPGPGLIYKKDLWIEVGGFDENYQFCEEDTFMHNIYMHGEIVYFIDEELYYYRIISASLSRDKTQVISKHMRDRIRFFRDVRRKALIKRGLIISAYNTTITYKRLEATEAGNYIISRMLSVFYMQSPKYLYQRLKLYLSNHLIKERHPLSNG